ncbi:MAG: M50 family metallopeptidase [Streptosporangiales bacterium]
MGQFAVLGGVGIVLFAVALIISIVLHEAGHFVFARIFGMKATEFFIGFGPRLWSRFKGDTEYGFKAIPAGGYVKIVGMTPLEQIDPADEPRAFYRQRPMHRFLVLIAGSLTHFLIAAVLLLIILMFVGIPVRTSTLTVEKVVPCVPTAGSCSAGGSHASPAAKSGLRAGDRIVGFNGKRVDSWKQLTADLEKSGGQKVRLLVDRGGKTIKVTPTLATRRDPESGKRIGYLGVVSKQRIAQYQTYDPLDAYAMTGQIFVSQVGLIFQALGGIPAAIPQLFSPDRGSTKGGQVGSVVGAARMAGSVFGSDEPMRAKSAYFLNMVQSVNLFIGVFNLLPLLPMDGGHVAVLAWERLRAWWARKRGRADPGPVDMTKLLPATTLVFVLLVGLGLLLITADLVNPLASPF